jgi:hypothetical protein
MYWMDWKISKRLDIVKDKYVNLFLSHLSSFSGITLTQSKKDKVDKAVGCLIYNIQYSLKDGNTLILTLDESDYSRPLIYNGKKVSRKVSYTYSKMLFSWLHCNKYAFHEIGFVGNWMMVDGTWKPMTSTQSKLILGDEILNDVFSIANSKQDLEPVTNVIRIRDSNKNYVAKRLEKEQQHLCKLLQRYNIQSKEVVIASNGIEFDVQVAKIYNNSSFKMGGRTYVVGGGSEVLKREHRYKLTFDGDKTVECDYKSLHARMIATIAGVSIPLDHDPYQIELQGYHPEAVRKICKLLVLCMFNAKNQYAAIKAVNKELNNEYVVDDNGEDVKITDYWLSKQMTPKHLELKYISDMLLQHNPFMKEHAFTGCGLELQNLDSRMMDIVVEYFTFKEEFCLPVHDSVVVRESLKDEAIQVMYEAYQQVMGNSDNCIVEVK